MDNIQRQLWSDDDLIPPKEAAIFLGGKSKPFSLSTLSYWRISGVGPKYIRIGGSIRYRVSSLKNFMLIEEKP